MYLLCIIHKQTQAKSLLTLLEYLKCIWVKQFWETKGYHWERIYLQLVYTIVYTSAHGTIYYYVLSGTIYYYVLMELYTIMFYESPSISLYKSVWAL